VTPARARLERRVADVAQAAVDARGFVTPVEVLVGVGWLDAKHVERWRRGQVPYLERVATANPSKLSTALRALAGWAGARGLNPSETVYVSWTRDRHRLRFTASGEENVERAYRTHWVSPQLRAAKQARRERAEHPGGEERANASATARRGADRTVREADTDTAAFGPTPKRPG
jgi:hypothetical protein